MEKSFRDICRELYKDSEEYYHRWYHERPVIITPSRTEELRELHRILYKCIDFMSLHYIDYTEKYMPLSEKEMQILEYQSRFPFKAGTYRPDYLLTQDGKLKLCEITSRFFAHGIFLSYFAEEAADNFMKSFPCAKRNCRYEELMNYMYEITGNAEKIFVLKSSDKTSAIKFYKMFYEYFGKSVTILEAEDVEKNISNWNGNFIISALNQKDILSFSMDTIKAMIDSSMYNDFRTIFLVHDKRFMKLWFTDEFTDAFLSKEETEFLRNHSIKTYICADAEKDSDTKSVMNEAYLKKDKYILKHYCLGKSEKVYAGILTPESEWKKLFDSGAVKDMIVQPFLNQKTFPVVWEGTHFNDYLCGMMLCVNDRFFDSGMFRTSSCPVTNKTDDRKSCAVATDCTELYPYGDIL